MPPCAASAAEGTQKKSLNKKFGLAKPIHATRRRRIIGVGVGVGGGCGSNAVAAGSLAAANFPPASRTHKGFASHL